MKKRVKTLVSLGLALCMLSGCANQVDTKPSEESTAGKGVSTEVASSEIAEASIYPDYLNMDGYRPIVKEDEEITLKVAVVRSTHATNSLEDVWYVRFIEEKLNINLEIEELTSQNVEERKTLMLASGDLPDLMIDLKFKTNDVMKYGVDEELFMPISDYFSEELTPNLLYTLENHKAACNLNTASNGKMYTMPTITETSATSKGNMPVRRVWINTKYMEAAGVEELPTTLEGYTEMLRKFKALNPAEMGVDVVYPMVSAGTYDRLFYLNAFGFMIASANNPSLPAWDIETNEVVVPSLTEKYGEYLEFLNGLYSEGLLHPDYYTMTTVEKRALFASGTVAVMGDSAPFVSCADTFDDWISLDALTTEYNPEGAVSRGQDYGLGVVYIAADTEYPELCLRLLDWMYSEEGSLYTCYGVPAGSEDTLGMVDGFTIEEGRVFKYGNIGSYESDYAYRCNVIQLFEQNSNCALATEAAYDAVGWNEEITYDMTNGDHNFRVKLINSKNGPLEESLPEAFVPADKLERYTDLSTVIKDYVDAESAKFVTGQRPLSEYNDYLAELKAMGSDEYLELVRSLYANYER